MKWILIALIVIYLLDGLRLRGRLSSINVAEPSDQPIDPKHHFVTAQDLQLSVEVKKAASAHARKYEIQVMDLIPYDLPVEGLMGLIQILDIGPEKERATKPGRSSGHVMLITEQIAEKTHIKTGTMDSIDFVQMAITLKEFAPRSMDHVLMPGLTASPISLQQRVTVTLKILRRFAPIALGVNMTSILLLLFGIIMEPAWGLAAILVFQLQPLIVFAGQSAQPNDLVKTLIYRIPQMIRFWAIAAKKMFDGYDREFVERLRPVYTHLLKDGIKRFYNERREVCPLCGSHDIREYLKTKDLYQHKPGYFVLETCDSCGHLFQNPGLSTTGMGFYYRDFYEGLGEFDMQLILGSDYQLEENRIYMCTKHHNPKNWLDVGGGYGHFPLVGRSLLPDTGFDALDQSEVIKKAEHRGWIDTGYQGQLQEFAEKLEDTYDTVSMFHYLEHTVNPEIEVQAASKVLKNKGYLLIEVPNPDSKLRTFLGRFWVPYFQPQHLHFLSIHNLEKMLQRNGFQIIETQFGPAHQSSTFVTSTWLFLEWLGPDRQWPWLPPESTLSRMRWLFIWTASWPFLLLAAVTDLCSDFFIRRSTSWASNYRVLAQKI